jgi:hypothetical protein
MPVINALAGYLGDIAIALGNATVEVVKVILLIPKG